MRRARAASGSWPVGRLVLAAMAAAIASAVVIWTVASGPPGGGPLLVPASVAMAILTVVLVRGRLPGLRTGTASLTIAAAGAVVTTDASAWTAATAGCGLVAVHELARWSTERRLHPPMPGGHERARWRHFCAVLTAGWALGVVTVLLAGGRIQLAAWQAVLAAVATVGIAAIVAAASRIRNTSDV